MIYIEEDMRKGKFIRKVDAKNTEDKPHWKKDYKFEGYYNDKYIADEKTGSLHIREHCEEIK